MNPIGAQRTLRRLLFGGLASLALVCSFNASAASAGSGRAYGLQVTADVVGVGLGVPIADTGQKTAPPDFNTPTSVVNASVAAGVGNLLTVRTGVLNSATQSKLAQNSVVSSSSVSGLALKLAGLALGADTISSQAKMSCVNGTLTPEGSAQILGASGSLAGVSVAANTRVDLTIGVPTLGTMVGVVLHTNEQTLSPDGKTLSVNGLRVELVASALGIRLLGASVIVGNSTATMADCAPTVTLGSLPLITTSNQAAIPVSGSCSAGSGNVAISSTPAGVTQSLPCSATGSYSGSVNTTTLADGPVTLTASQSPAGPTSAASQATTKNTAPVLQPPVVTVVSAPHITLANQASYGVSGTCSANGAAVSILVGAVPASAQCSGGLWSASGLNVTAVPNGAVTVTASQTVSGLLGSGSFTTSKDAAGVLPVVVVTSAPAITAANQASYTVSGTCSVNGTNVSVVIEPFATSVPCTGNIWAAAGLDLTALPNGSVTVTASQTVGNQTGSGSLGTTKDSAGAIPVVTISLAPAITLANQAAYSVSGSCSVNGNNVAVLVGSVAASALCTNGSWSTAGLDVSGLPNGAVTVMASQTVGAQTGSATLVTSKDVTGAVPVVAVTSAPAITALNQGSYTVSGTCSASGSNVAVLIGSVAAAAPCNGGLWSTAAVDVSGLLDGAVTVTASQTVGGQTGSGSLQTSKNTVVDAPVVTISSAPAITALNEGAYTVSGTCSANGTNVAVLVGSVAAAAPCTGNIWSSSGLDVSGLADGPVLVSASQTVGTQTGSGTLVTAKDTAGVAPVVTISAAPAITALNEAAYTVSGTCSVNGTNVSVLVGSVSASAACDAGLWTTSALNVAALPDGAVTVTASQTANGQTGSGTLVIAKDTAGVAPSVAVTSAPAISAGNQASYVVSGTCSANGSNVAVLVGSIAESAICDGGVWATAGLDVSGLPDGAVTVTATQTVGGQTGSGSVVTAKDTAGIAPVVAISSAPAITAANASAYTVSGTCTVDGSNVAVLVGSVAASAPCSGGIWTSAALDVSGLPDGSVTVTASQTAGGLTGSGSLVTAKDTAGVAPSVAITSAAAITAANQSAYVVSGTCSVNGTDVSVLVGQVAATAPCNNGAWTSAAMDVSGLPAGAVTVMASQSVGGQTGSASLVVTKESGGSAPVVSITSAPEITAANQSAYTVSGTCSVNGAGVAVQIGTISASAACNSGSWTTAAQDVSALPDGLVTLTASQTVGGGTGAASLVIGKNAAGAAPVVTIGSAPPITLANQASYSVFGSCSANGTNVAVQVGNVSATPLCDGGSWSASGLDVSALLDGVVVVTAEQIVGGLSGSDSVETTKTTAVVVPVVVITSAPAITALNQAAYTVSGTCSANGQAVSVLVGTLPATAPCSDGIWATAPIDVSGLDDGQITVQASQDAGGQTGTVSLVISKDTAGAAPAVSVTSAPAITAANQSAYTVSGTCSAHGEAVAVEIGTVPASAQCNAGIWSSAAVDVTALPNGPVTVKASQTLNGQTGSGSLVTNKDAAGVTPVVSVTSAPAITAANQTAYTVSGTCSVDGSNVAVLVGSVATSALCNAGIWSSAAVDVTALPDGAVTVMASQTANGQSGSGSLVTSKDSAGVAPVVAITSAPAITALNVSAYSVSGSCSAYAEAVTVQVGSLSTSAQCNLGIWATPAIDVSALADGSVTVTASQLVGGLTGSGSLVIGKDTAGTAPVVSVTLAATITAANQASYAVSGSCSANGSPVAVQVGSVAATASCAGGNWAATGLNVTALADGSVTVTAAQTVGNVIGSGSLLTLKDTAGVAPVVTVTSAPGITAANQASYVVSGSCSANGSNVAVQVGAVAASAPCAGNNWAIPGVDVSSLPDGVVTVTAAQTVGALQGSGSLVTNKTTGAVQPVVTITSAPDITASNQAAYTVAGTCSVNGTNVDVEVGSVSASVPCTSNSWTTAALNVSTLPDGTVTVTAAQTVGGQSGSDSVDVNKATGGAIPVVTITSAPAITAANASAYSVSGTCSVGGSNVDVEVGSVSATALCNGGIWATEGMDVSGLADGSVEVTATQTVGGQTGVGNFVTSKDAAGVAPAVAITSAPAITAANQSAYTVSGTCSANGANVDVLIGGLAASAVCNSGIWASSAIDVSGLANGPVSVSASLTVGGQTGSGGFTTSKDAAGVVPVVAISSAPAITALNQGAYTVSGTCSADGATVTVLIGSIAASAPCNAGIWASAGVDVSGLADGAVTVMASQTAGGQTGSGSLVTTKDSAGAAPVVAITSAPAITAANQTAYTVSGTCSAEGANVSVLVGAIAASAVCNGGIWASAPIDVSGLPDGPVSVSVSQTAGGKTGTGGFVTSKDAAGAAPAVAITSAPAITAANQTGYTVSGTCTADGSNVAVLIGSLSVSATCNGGIWATPAVDVSGLPDGPITVTASQTAGGQTGSGGFVTSKDSAGTKPSVAITSAPAITAANQTAYTVSGSCSVNGSNVVVLIGSLSVTASCNDGTWTTGPVDVSGLPNGPITVTVSQTAGGQTGTGGFVTSKDSAGSVPVVTVTSAPAITLANQGAYTVSGSCSAAGTNVAILVGSIPASAPCNAGAWSASGIDVSSLPDGAVTVTAAQTVGSLTGSGSLVTSKQGTTASVTVTAAPRISSANQASYGGVSGNCSAAAGAVTVAIGSISNTVACTGGNWTLGAVDVRSLPEGTVVVTASQTVAGTVISGTRNTVKDTTAPAVSITTAANIDNANQDAYSPAGTCSTGDGIVTVSVGSIPATAACASGSWTASGMRVGALPNGQVTVTASQTDEAGNTGSSTRQVTKSSDSGGEPPEPPAGRIAAQSGTWIVSDELNGEPGRGMGIDIQDGVLFMQLFGYRESGEPTFFTALGSLRDNTVTAPLYYYEGGRFFGSEQRDGHEAGSPGNVVITFTSRTTGTIQFPGEPAKAMQRFDYEGTPAGVFSDPAFVDRWAMVELNSSNQPVRSWWADIGTSEQVAMSEDWAATAMDWPYPPGVATTVHGFGGTLSGQVVAQCSYGGTGVVFNCSGQRDGGANAGLSVALRLQRDVDQLSGTLQEGGGEARRLVGFRVGRAAYTWQDNQSVRTSYYAPGYAPESGTWVVSSELRGLPGRGLSIELQKPINSEDHMLFMSVYDYESDGKATFHSVLGAHDASTTPEPHTPDLSTVQYQGGRYFGGPAAIASFKADAGPTRAIHFSAPSVGTLAFPGEDPVQIERFYYGVNKGSAQSLRGSWVLLSETDAMPSRSFRFQTRDANSVIDTESGYVCVAQVLRQFNFHCTGPSGSPAFRFVAGFYGASTGIVGDAEDAPAITVVRVTDPNGERVQAGD